MSLTPDRSDRDEPFLPTGTSAAPAAPGLDEAAVARWLADQPDFLARHPDVLALMRLPSPHDGRALSFQDRQIEILRDKLSQLERRLAELVHVSRDNEAISGKMLHWVRHLLRAESVERLPGIIADSMRREFTVPLVALRLWRVDPALVAPEWLIEGPPGSIRQIDEMALPYCGPRGELAFASWLPSAGADARSIALIPLRRGIEPFSFGLLVLGSGDPERFQAAMGTSFLERIGEIASAALGRLVVETAAR
jgi:uncharacterized protein YigA (DUF484 family)